jgi:TPR repeat protein
MVLLGECYEDGAGVDIDSTLALKWFQRAAE